MFDDAVSLGEVLRGSVRVPPVDQVTLLVKLSALVIKPMGDLMTNHPADGSIVEVLGSVTAKEDSLKDASRKLDGVLQGRVECIDNGRVGTHTLAPHIIMVAMDNAETR